MRPRSILLFFCMKLIQNNNYVFFRWCNLIEHECAFWTCIIGMQSLHHKLPKSPSFLPPPPPTPGQTPWSWPKSHQVTMAQTKTTKINMMEPKKMALMDVVRPLSKIYNSGTLINSRPARRSRRTRKTLAFWRQVETLNGAFPPIPQWCESPRQALGCPKCIKHTAPWFLRNKNVLTSKSLRLTSSRTSLYTKKIHT